MTLDSFIEELEREVSGRDPKTSLCLPLGEVLAMAKALEAADRHECRRCGFDLGDDGLNWDDCTTCADYRRLRDEVGL